MMKNNSVQAAKKKVTKPSVMTDDTVRNLGGYLMEGFSIESACHLAGVSRTAYYENINRNELMKQFLEICKNTPSETAIRNIIREINGGNLKASMWYLERVLPNKFGKRVKTSIEYLKITQGSDN